MQAIVYHEYGSPDVLELEEVDTPAMKDHEVLVRVRAASVNPLDWHFLTGTPYIARLQTGLLRPRHGILGVDVAGQVEAVGSNVTQFQPGDEVFGGSNGSFAEYVCVSESAIVQKPPNLTFEEAAAVPIAAFTALQGLRDKGGIRRGHKVLINGASGGVGTFAVQIAKSFGAEVTGVCSTKNVEMVRSIGADRVIDYSQEDFTQDGQRYDILLDMVGNRSLSECRRALNAKGILIVVGGPKARWLGPLVRVFKALLVSLVVSQKLVPMLAHQNKDDLIFLQRLLEAGEVTPVIDRRYTLSEVPQALRHQGEGHTRGKTVITV
ncbi:MAG: NAD(P)-dependent alcohol dehydrogenase [Actinomycetota bacterium]|nr:NAD(P)-dependent alcohol dehydrogenase [Actinomycetota bacterium]